MTLAEQAAKQGSYAKTKHGFAQDQIAGSKLTKDLPLLATNLKDPKHQAFLFGEYKKQGLIPDRFKTPKDLFDYVGRYLHSELDRGVLEPEGFNRRKGEILAELVQKERIKQLTDAQKANPEIMEQISKMRWKGLPIKVSSDGTLSFDRRYYQDKVSKRVINYANSIEEGLGDRWAKEMRKSWNAIGEKNRELKKLVGKDFDIGHFVPSAFGGPNVGMNATSEASRANRAKGSTPFTADRNVARQLGIPESWMQAFTDWHLREQGMDANLLPKDAQLKGHQITDVGTGESEATAEIAKNLRKAEIDAQPLDKGKLQADFEIKNGKVVKKVNKPKSGVIQNIVRDGKTIFTSVINNKKVDQVIDAGSKVIGNIPKPIKVAGTALPIVGAVGDTSAIAGAVFDQNESVEQQKINDMKAISGGLGLIGFKLPPAWIPSTMMWGLAEMEQWKLNKKKEKIKERELYYMNKYIQATDDEGNPVPATLGSGKRTVNRRGRRIQ